jgi:uncharacterized protein (TIRG00374 family)
MSWRSLVQWLGLALGLVTLGWFLATVDWRGLVDVMRRVHWAWIGVAVVVMVADYFVHAWRWKILLRHVDPELDWHTLWRATTILWGFNTLLPLRAGNLLRPAVVSSKRGVPYTTLLVTVVAESVCDLFGTAMLVLWMIALLPSRAAASPELARVRVLGVWGAVAAIAVLVFVIVLSSRRARQGFARALDAFPSDRLRTPILAGFDQMVMGLGAVGEPLRMVEALAVTMLMWVGWLVALVATLRAFDLSIPLAGALFVETALTLSMMLPQAPGFLGVFQVVVEDALALFGANRAEGEAVALAFWAICFVPITVLGAWDAWRLGLSPASAVPARPAVDQRA